MENIDLEHQTKYTLELIFGEANKMAGRTLKSLSENVNKSFVLFALYLSLFSFSITKIFENDYLYIVIALGCIISGLLLHKNLFPLEMVLDGALPENMIDDYFKKFKDEQLEKEYLATQIQTYNSSIKTNTETIRKMVDRFRSSGIALIISLLLFIAIWVFLRFCESPHA